MQAIEHRIIVRIFFSFLVLALVGILAGVSHHFQRDAEVLVDAANRVEAVINNKNCANAGLVYYAFAVDGDEYRGASNACVASCAKAKMGEKVEVTYEIKNPQNSICGSAEQIASRFNANYYGLFLVGLGLLMVVFRTTRRTIT
jgi:hypothetical protein